MPTPEQADLMRKELEAHWRARNPIFLGQRLARIISGVEELGSLSPKERRMVGCTVAKLIATTEERDQLLGVANTFRIEAGISPYDPNF